MRIFVRHKRSKVVWGEGCPGDIQYFQNKEASKKSPFDPPPPAASGLDFMKFLYIYIYFWNQQTPTRKMALQNNRKCPLKTLKDTEFERYQKNAAIVVDYLSLKKYMDFFSFSNRPAKNTNFFMCSLSRATSNLLISIKLSFRVCQKNIR